MNPKYLKTFLPRFLIVVSIFAFSLFITPQKTFAAINPWSWISNVTDPDLLDWLCTPTVATYQRIANDQPQLTIVRFGYNYDTVRYLKLYYNTMGSSIDNTIRCIPVIGSVTNALCEAFRDTAPSRCTGVQGLMTYNQDGSYTTEVPDIIKGSPLAMYYDLQNTVTRVKPPLNMAYFAKRQLANVPIIGKTYAADINSQYTSPFLPEIYWGWKLIRDMSFALLSVIMLVVGVMIMTRAKVDNQTLVTVQYSLPKIVLAIFLTAFSYPIGAFIANVFYNLAIRSPFIIYNTAQSASLTYDISTFFSSGGGGVLLLNIMLYILSTFLFIGLSPVVLIVLLLTVLIVLGFMVTITIKFLITYVKLVFHVMLSPVTFVIAAIPGNDTRITDWFKKAFAYGLSMVALLAMPILIWIVGLEIIAGRVLGGNTINFVFGGVWVDILMLCFFILGGLMMTTKLPGQIEEALMGKKRK